MLQHIIGTVIGAVVAYLILFVTIGSQYSSQLVTGLAIGAIVTILWPLVIGGLLVRRRMNKRDDQIQKEVDKRLSEQK